MTDIDRLIELLMNGIVNNLGTVFQENVEPIADYLLANGVRVIDTKVINPKNRELITHFAGMPINDVLDLVRAEKEERLIRPPCKVGDMVYTYGARRVKEWKITFCGKNSRGEHKMIAADDGFENLLEFWDYDMGKTVFLTKEEAEEKLKELSNG